MSWRATKFAYVVERVTYCWLREIQNAQAPPHITNSSETDLLSCPLLCLRSLRRQTPEPYRPPKKRNPRWACPSYIPEDTRCSTPQLIIQRSRYLIGSDLIFTPLAYLFAKQPVIWSFTVVQLQNPRTSRKRKTLAELYPVFSRHLFSDCLPGILFSFLLPKPSHQIISNTNVIPPGSWPGQFRSSRSPTSHNPLFLLP